ncbi:MAG: CBS domain-containing protein [Cytophagales bacterium]|nr:MAG: CBS domain-containing protein [Cytophagales bacterium]
MIAEELINQMIPPLKPTDTAGKALSWMNNLHLAQLPVVDEKKYQGIVTEDAINESEDLSKPISLFNLAYSDLAVHTDTHFYEVLEKASKNKLQIVSVLDHENKYLGVISVVDISAAVANMFASQGPGGIIVLSMKSSDYSLAQISRLVESNDAKIISSFINQEDRDTNLIRLTLKLDKIDLTRIIATLERYSYKVVAQFQESSIQNLEQDKLDMFFKYLNM